MKENKYWNPAKIGPKTENEVSAWAFGIPNLPMFPNKATINWMKEIQSLEGFLGFRPEFPNGTILICKTENDAKRIRNRVKSYGVPTGGIAECFIPKEYAK